MKDVYIYAGGAYTDVGGVCSMIRKKNAPTFSFCVTKCVDFWLHHVNMKEKARKRPCIPQEASQTAHFLHPTVPFAGRSRRLCQPP